MPLIFPRRVGFASFMTGILWRMRMLKPELAVPARGLVVLLVGVDAAWATTKHFSGTRDDTGGGFGDDPAPDVIL